MGEETEKAGCVNWCLNCNVCSSEKIPFISSLPSGQKKQLVAHSVQRCFRKGSELFCEGESVENLYIILTGKVKLVRYDAEGREQIVGIFGAGETIWEGILKKGSTFPYSAVAMTSSWCCMIEKNVFLDVLREPEVSLHVIAMLSDKLHDANTRSLFLSTKDPKNRLAAFLLYEEQREGVDCLNLRLEDIAASLGIRSETVSRKLGELADEGLIAREGKSGIRILDPESLRPET